MTTKRAFQVQSRSERYFYSNIIWKFTIYNYYIEWSNMTQNLHLYSRQSFYLGEIEIIFNYVKGFSSSYWKDVLIESQVFFYNWRFLEGRGASLVILPAKHSCKLYKKKQPTKYEQYNLQFFMCRYGVNKETPWNTTDVHTHHHRAPVSSFTIIEIRILKSLGQAFSDPTLDNFYTQNGQIRPQPPIPAKLGLNGLIS
jgi:hypothetical protein